jgi:hypothetical protein
MKMLKCWQVKRKQGKQSPCLKNKGFNNLAEHNPAFLVPKFQIRLHKKDGDKPGKLVKVIQASKVTNY